MILFYYRRRVTSVILQLKEERSMEDKNTFGGGHQKLDRTKKLVSVGLLITGIFVVFLGITYAFTNRALTGTKKQVINVGNLSLELQEDDNNLTIVDAFPTYDEVGMIGNAFTFRLINKTLQDTNYILKLADITSGEKLFLEDVKCGLTKDGQVTIHLLSDLQDNTVDSGVILGNQTIEYALRLWIKDSVEDDARIAGKSLSFKVEIEQTSGDVDNPTPTSTPEPSGEPATDKVFASENLGENCTTYNDGVDTFLVGQCQNNYVWYSGKLWRVVLKNNETGAVKMVTDNAITVITLAEREDSNILDISYVEQWLKQEFLPSLHDYDDYLVTDSVWDVSSISTTTPTRLPGETTLSGPVGLLNVYEYYTTYNASNGIASYYTGYLNNDVAFWLHNYYKGKNQVYKVHNTGAINYTYGDAVLGVRPVVNMRSDVKIVSGNGSISEPFKLISDSQNTINGVTPLSTRYSGEYVNFNNELYRIMNIENEFVKIIAVTTPESLKSKVFDSNVPSHPFPTTDIKSELEMYYQKLDGVFKNMIQQNMIWYYGIVTKQGSYNVADSNYKLGICAGNTVEFDTLISTCEKTTSSVSSNIGMSRIGEMFASQITRGNQEDFWLITPHSSSQNIHVVQKSGYGSSAATSSSNNVRPSLYLKSNVVIAKDNTGDGTYEHPYEIELGA